MHSFMTETNVAAAGPFAMPDTAVKPVTFELAASEEHKSQPWKAFIEAREAQATEIFLADAPIRVIRGEELAPLLISD